MAERKNKKKINVLVTGSNGQLGKSLNFVYNRKSIYNLIFKTKKQLNIINYDQLKNYIKDNNIQIIINAAAYTNVNLAQKNSKASYLVNAEGVKIISDLCNKFNIILIHISTDYVYDGLKKKPYKKNDLCYPLSVYGKSKLKGDRYIIKNSKNYIILRLAWLYGPFGNNFFTKVINKFLDNNFYQMVTNQYAFPSSSIQLAKDILKIIPRLIMNKNNKKYFGIYNYGPYQHKISRYIFVKKLSKLIINNTGLIKRFKLDKKVIKNKFSKININDLSIIRPKNSMLDNNSFFKTFKIKKHSFDKNLKLSLSIYLNNIIK